MLDLKRLNVFREVGRCGSFSAAATELRFSASAVSQQIAQLEREVGMTLVERSTTGVVLTPAGERLFAHANAILARAADAEEELRQLRGGSVGRLRVAAIASAAAALMPEAIVEFRSALPRVEVELVEQDRLESLEQLARGELDLAVVHRPPEPTPEGVVVVPLPDDIVDVLLPRDHRLAGCSAVSLQELRDEPWADCPGQAVPQQLGALGVEPNVVFISDHHRVLEGVVAAGVAVSFMPRLWQPVARDDVVVKPIVPVPIVRPVGIALRDGNRRPAAVQSMVEILSRLAAARAIRVGPRSPLEDGRAASDGQGRPPNDR